MALTDEIKIIKSILNLYCKTGATLEDIADDYMCMIGKKFAVERNSKTDVENFLTKIDGVHSKIARGQKLWFIDNENTKHIKKLILEQKSFKQEKPKIDYEHKSTKECFYKDNYVYKYKRSKLSFSAPSNDHGSKNRSAIDAQLMGDDLFLSILAGKQSSHTNARERIRQLGLSRSNLTIKMATEFLKSVAYINTRSIIFNVGSVDIIRGASVADMKRNYIEMIGVCRNRNVHPIITTLAPIGNVNFSNHIQRKIVEMNNFLIEHFGSNVIDLWSLMVNSTGRMKSEFFKRSIPIIKECYHPFVLWSITGQKFIFDHISKKVPNKLRNLKS